MFASQFVVEALIFTNTFWDAAPFFGVANPSLSVKAAAKRFL